MDTIYVDFSKAFDKVPQNLLITKIAMMGFPAWITEWIRSYLTNRKAYVKLGSTRSREFLITSGVPQGSVLGPLLFVLFLNDIHVTFASKLLFFADDLKIYRQITSSADCYALQADMEELLRWCISNGMEINVSKTKVITFTRRQSCILFDYKSNSTLLNRVDSIQDLGVVFDSKLKFNEHVSHSTAKAFAVLGFIKRSTTFFTDIYALKSLYCSLVRSILEYAVPVWAPYHSTLSSKIERVQKCFVRYGLRLLPWRNPNSLPDYTERCRLIDLELLSSRRVKLQRLFIFDVLMSNIDCPELLQLININVPYRRLRNHQFISLPRSRTTYGYYNPFLTCMREFNNVSEAFDFNISKTIFKHRLRTLA